jgi:hypothetical protein
MPISLASRDSLTVTRVCADPIKRRAMGSARIDSRRQIVPFRSPVPARMGDPCLTLRMTRAWRRRMVRATRKGRMKARSFDINPELVVLEWKRGESAGSNASSVMMAVSAYSHGSQR